MSRGRRANPTLIGVFVLGAIAVTTAVVVVWGSGRFFRQTKPFVAYFSGSVSGLNPGAPVKFRGVQIGTVTEMRFRVPQPEATTPEQFRIPVWFEIDQKRLSDLRGRPVRLDRARFDQLIGQGMRAQLQSESFVTGVLYVGLDFFPGSPVDLVHANPEVFEVPTMPTTLERASQALTGLMTRLEKADLEGLLRSIHSAVDGMNELVRSPEIGRTLVAAGDALSSIRALADGVQPNVAPTLRSLAATSASARASLERLDAALADLRTLINTQGPLTVGLTQTLVDLGDAAQSVRDLASYLDRKPNAIITGRPGS